MGVVLFSKNILCVVGEILQNSAKMDRQIKYFVTLCRKKLSKFGYLYDYVGVGIRITILVSFTLFLLVFFI